MNSLTTICFHTKRSALSALAAASVAFAAANAHAHAAPMFSLSKPFNSAAEACSWEFYGSINNGCNEEVMYQFPISDADWGGISVTVTGYSKDAADLVYCQIVSLDRDRNQYYGQWVPIPANPGVGTPYQSARVSGTNFTDGVASLNCVVPIGDGINQVYW